MAHLSLHNFTICISTQLYAEKALDIVDAQMQIKFGSVHKYFFLYTSRHVIVLYWTIYIAP